jgi:hypothetical protein
VVDGFKDRRFEPRQSGVLMSWNSVPELAYLPIASLHTVLHIILDLEFMYLHMYGYLDPNRPGWLFLLKKEC